MSAKSKMEDAIQLPAVTTRRDLSTVPAHLAQQAVALTAKT